MCSPREGGEDASQARPRRTLHGSPGSVRDRGPTLPTSVTHVSGRLRFHLFIGGSRLQESYNARPLAPS